MAKIIKPPFPIELDGKESVFLAGTIDNGNSLDWQSEVERRLLEHDIVILNPRRDQWDSSWPQTIEHKQFKEQVEWELDGLERCDAILMYFAPGSKSPITLLELGLYARAKKLIIVSPQGFWRRGNIEVVAARFGIPLFESLPEGLLFLDQFWSN